MKNIMYVLRALVLALLVFPCVAAAQSSTETVVVDTSAPSHALPHFWEHMFGSGRAVLSLRESYRRDLKEVKQITDFQYVRFHGLLMDEMGVYDEDDSGNPTYNFSYVDQAYDGLLANGVRPFVELSFMPKKLASDPKALHAFWYKQNVSPPTNYSKWDGLITQLATHLVERYGIDEVSKWYFEVWNEPNLDFWGGDPKQATYFELYDHTARALKAVNPRIRVGGPSTAQAAWADVFIQHCVENKIPIDFVSSHVYGNDKSEDIFGTHETIARNSMVCRAIGKVHDQIQHSSLPNLPLIWSEFNASYMNEHDVTDTSYMGPWMADTIRQCDGLVTEMSYWTFSDVFEEQGVVKQPFYGGFGLIAPGGIPKPAFNAFKLLHGLGEERIPTNSDSALATRRKDGTVVVAVWNMADPGKDAPTKSVKMSFPKTKRAKVTLLRLDPAHGDVNAAYQKMGSPRYPTAAQLAQLRTASQMKPAETRKIKDSSLTIDIPAHGLVVLQFKP